MVFSPHRKCGLRAGRTAVERLLAVGFLTVAVGFLTPAAAGAPLDDALERLDRLEAERAGILDQADSLGVLLTTLPAGSDRAAAGLLQAAEGLGERSQEIELEILLARQRCRSLADQELESLGTPSTPEELRRESVLLDLLDRRLGDDWGGSLVLVEPDSSDGYETLLDKQAYLADLQDRIAALDESLGRRIERSRREEALRKAGERFADESRFLDEGGRVGSDETVYLRNLPTGDYSGDGMARLRPSGGGLEGSDEPGIEAPPAGSPGGGTLEALLAARARLERDLGRVAAALQATETLLARYERRPR